VKLLAFFRAIFGCRHRDISRVFTIKSRTYKVCFDCGREFDLPNEHAPKRSSTSPDIRVKNNSYRDQAP
jgi:hypothetical protein